MGYYKSTTYYSPTGYDYSDHSPEAVVERKPMQQHYIATNFDSPVCVACQKPAPAGLVWVDGLCDICTANANEFRRQLK